CASSHLFLSVCLPHITTVTAIPKPLRFAWHFPLQQKEGTVALREVHLIFPALFVPHRSLIPIPGPHRTVPSFLRYHRFTSLPLAVGSPNSIGLSLSISFHHHIAHQPAVPTHLQTTTQNPLWHLPLADRPTNHEPYPSFLLADNNFFAFQEQASKQIDLVSHRLTSINPPYPTSYNPTEPTSSSSPSMPLCGGNKTVQRKLVLLGDGACGKTSLLNVFTRGYFPTVYEPTVFENYVHDIFVDSVHIELSLWDTAGQEEFDRLRSLSYDDTDLIMLCYSVDSKDSLENVESKWVGEIADNCPGVKLVLVALKCDLREADNEEEEAAEGQQREKRPMISYEQGLEVARRINALRYLECSAMRNRGVNEAFTEAARVALSVKKDREESQCIIM
ncbi:GTP-binding protein RHO3, partial [Colletotrichum salicis]